jgi:hypothetical protein
MVEEKEKRMEEMEEQAASSEREPVKEKEREYDLSSADGGYTELMDEDKAEGFRSRWTEIQTGFVDNPRSSVERADELVAMVVKNITDSFAEERAVLEDQWSRGGEASTEDLRVAIKRYRSFFNRLLSL